MNYLPGYILVIGSPPTHAKSTRLGRDDVAQHDITQNSAASIAKALRCPVFIAETFEEAIAKATTDHPYLILLSGNSRQTWSPQLIRQLRQSVEPSGVMIVALTPSSDLNWHLKSEITEITEITDIDGCFIEPMSFDVLSALNESAIAQKKYLQTA